MAVRILLLFVLIAISGCETNRASGTPTNPGAIELSNDWKVISKVVNQTYYINGSSSKARFYLIDATTILLKVDEKVAVCYYLKSRKVYMYEATTQESPEADRNGCGSAYYKGGVELSFSPDGWSGDRKYSYSPCILVCGDLDGEEIENATIRTDGTITLYKRHFFGSFTRSWTQVLRQQDHLETQNEAEVDKRVRAENRRAFERSLQDQLERQEQSQSSDSGTDAVATTQMPDTATGACDFKTLPCRVALAAGMSTYPTGQITCDLGDQLQHSIMHILNIENYESEITSWYNRFGKQNNVPLALFQNMNNNAISIIRTCRKSATSVGLRHNGSGPWMQIK